MSVEGMDRSHADLIGSSYEWGVHDIVFSQRHRENTEKNQTGHKKPVVHRCALRDLCEK